MQAVSAWPFRRPQWVITTRQAIVHLSFFLVTSASIYLCGVLASDTSGTSLGQLISDPKIRASGLTYTLTLVAILLAHELGHYVACRYYGIRASLPYFLPAPPIIGTFGAFIRIKDPIQSKRALFDIGIAGPLAGFAIALPTVLVGLMISQPAPPAPVGAGVMVFHDPLLLILLEKAFGFPRMVHWNPIYFAAWVGLLATSLNLLPVGQLDGGHVTYAILGKRGHRRAAGGIFLLMCVLAIVAYRQYQWAGWFVYVLLLGLLLGLKHPPVVDEDEPIGSARIVIGLVGLIVFALTFMPFPISFS